ncbi:MAG: hypothetical protein E6K65_01420 [Nitrospirae bacterium]|nr:MAG: hypothetical protein E6K65_01420 [Nitrospirota bacterium]
MGAGEVEDRLTQLGRAADGLIHSIEAGNAPEKDLPLSGCTDGVEHDAAEQERQQQIIYLIPVHPVRLWRNLHRRGDSTIVTQHGSHGDAVGGPVVQLDPPPTPQRELVLVSSRRPCPPGPLGFTDIVLVRGELRHDFHRSWIWHRGSLAE